MPPKIAHIGEHRSYEFIELVVEMAKSFIIIENIILRVNRCIYNYYNI
jgi:hypothetical protein